jgi:hypothetical protein
MLSKQTQITLAVGVTRTAFRYGSLPRVSWIRNRKEMFPTLKYRGRDAARHTVKGVACLFPYLKVLFSFMCLFIILSVLYNIFYTNIILDFDHYLIHILGIL